MWPCVPRTVTVALRLPRRPILIMSPSDATLVGSPTRHASSFSPRDASHSSTFRVPLIETPSSSPVMRRLIEPPKFVPRARDELRRRRGETRHRRLHVGGAAPDQHAVAHDGRERIAGPGLARAGRHHVGMAGETEIAARRTDARIKIEDRIGAGLGKFLELAAEAEFFQRAGEMRQRARVGGRDAGRADQRLGQRQRVNRCGHVGNRRAAIR